MLRPQMRAKGLVRSVEQEMQWLGSNADATLTGVSEAQMMVLKWRRKEYVPWICSYYSGYFGIKFVDIKDASQKENKGE